MFGLGHVKVGLDLQELCRSVVQRRPVWLECVCVGPPHRDDVQSTQTDRSSSEQGQVREGPRSEAGPGA